MVIELNIDFNEMEKAILSQCKDIDIKLFVDTDSLFHIGVSNGVEYRKKITQPNRMIAVNPFFLLEEKDELGTWYMGQLEDAYTYCFWGNYGDLETTIKAL